jgi:proline iminopeptidase
MTQARLNDLTIEYEDEGPPDGPPILLIMGLGMQLVAWPAPFCAGLAARGFRVIRFDNRDAGLSSKSPWRPRLGLRTLMFAAWLGIPVRPPYTLDDMAEDAVGLMDALGVKRAHIVGVSMGGMIAQIVAAKHPERATSLVSMMSSSGRRGLPDAEPQVTRALLRRRPQNLDEAIDFGVNLLQLIGSPGYPADRAHLTTVVERGVRRSYNPRGLARQLLAIATAPSRVELLRTIRVPALVMHGADDPLVPLAAGKDTAASIAGARLMVIPGWGHDLPEPLTPLFVETIADHCRAAEVEAMAATNRS